MSHWQCSCHLSGHVTLLLCTYMAHACSWSTLGLLGLEYACFLLVAHVCEMAKLMTSFALILLGRVLESLHVDCVTTFGASVPVMVCTLCAALAVCDCCCPGFCSYFVWASRVVFSSCIYQLATLCAGASVG